MADLVELKSCPNPWCSASNPKICSQLFRRGDYCVECFNCAIRGPVKQTEAEAIAAWNTRADTVNRRDAIIAAVVEEAEQSCRYVAKHNVCNMDAGDYRDGFETGCEVCEKAIAEHVKRHDDRIPLTTERREAIVEAIEQAIAWHEEHDEAISKKPDALTPYNVWQRLHHQEQRDMLRAALIAGPVSEGERV